MQGDLRSPLVETREIIVIPGILSASELNLLYGKNGGDAGERSATVAA